MCNPFHDDSQLSVIRPYHLKVHHYYYHHNHSLFFMLPEDGEEGELTDWISIVLSLLL